jgi:uncharacterized protein
LTTTIDHLPFHKQEEIRALTELIVASKEVHMVILYGSFATGKWVKDLYVENGTTYEYASDYDLLVILTHEEFMQKVKIENKIDQELVVTGKVKTPVNTIFHGIKQINQALSEGNYFFSDIKKEGILLYDSGQFKLVNSRKLTPEETKQKAEDYFEQWFASANEFFIDFDNAFGRNSLHKAAFELHQAAERYYITISLVFTDYRTKGHSLKTLGIQAGMCDKRFMAVFPEETEEEKRLFELLKRAYVDARYKMNDYHVTREELEHLAERVKMLRDLTEEICQKKIVELGYRENK